MFESVDRRTTVGRQTDTGVTGILFGSGELTRD